MDSYYLFKIVFLDNEQDAFHHQELEKREKYYRVSDLKHMLKILKEDYGYADVLSVECVDTVQITKITELKRLTLKENNENG